MEEKNLRELNMDELEKVSGGAGPFETLYTYIENAGLFPTIAKMTRKQAVQFMLDYIDKNGISGALRCYANAVYDHIPSIYLH